MSSLAWHEVVHSASSLSCVLFGASLSFSLNHARTQSLDPSEVRSDHTNPGIVCWFSQLPKGDTRKPHYASMSLVVYRETSMLEAHAAAHTVFWTGSACGLVFCHFQISNPFPSSRNISKHIFFININRTV